MRKIVVTEFISLDGVFEAPGPDGSGFKYEGWTFDFHNPEVEKFKSDEVMRSDAQLLGRITYEAFAEAWPKMKDSTGEFGKKFNEMPKYVVSNTLEEAKWENSHIIKGDVATEIKKLKEEEGGDILVSGSGTLVKTLMENNLVDELTLLVYPVVLGEGKRFFKEGIHQKLKLLETKQFGEVVLLRFQPTP